MKGSGTTAPDGMIMLRNDPALARLLDPGDRIVTGLRAQEKAWSIAALVTGTVLPAGWLVVALVTRQVAVAGPLFVAVVIGYAAVQFRQRAFFVGVTDRLLICHGLSNFRGRPTRLLFTAPLGTVTLTVVSRTRLGTTIAFSGPGVEPESLRLLVSRRLDDYLDVLLACLGDREATVAGQPGG